MDIDLYMMKMAGEFRSKFGLEFTSLEKGKATATFTVKDEHRNPFGMVYGGIIYNLADIVAGVAFFSAGSYGPTVEGSMKYLSSTEGIDKLILEGAVIKNGSNIGFVEVSVRDESGNLLEKGSFTYFNSAGRG